MRKNPQYEMKLLFFEENAAQFMCKNFNNVFLKGKIVVCVQQLECLVL